MPPIVNLIVPCSFMSLEEEEKEDMYKELGINTEEEEEIEDVTVNVDCIMGYTPLNNTANKDYTLFYAGGFKMWAALPYSEFDKRYKQAKEEFNQYYKVK